ncbi:MAG: hypothetical protein ACTHMJ_22700 [Thermomicrobiales bacterium]
MATPEGDIPLKHLPLDVLHRLIARAEAEARTLPPLAAEDTPAGEVDALLASVGLRTHQAPAVDLEPLRGELARRINESREVARQRSALYRSHVALGLLEFRERLTRVGLEQFIREAGQRLYDETGAPPLYLLVPPAVYHRQLIGIYNIFGAAIAGQPLVLTTSFGPLKVTPSDLVNRITLV